MKYISVVLLVFLLALNACQAVSKGVSSAKSAASAATALVASWTSCSEYNSMVKQGTGYYSADSMQYYCTDASNASRHLRYRVFDDNTVARQEHGQAETVQNLDYDLDPCFFNLLDAQANIAFDFYSITLNGSKRMTQFREVPFGGAITTWDCAYLPDAAI